MNLTIKHLIIGITACLIGLPACVNDLDTIPLDVDVVTSGVVYDDPNSYIQVLAKIYAGLAVTGQQGPAGQGDIDGIDEGFGQYLRMLYYHQELTTDEAVVGWNDQTIKDFHNQSWTSEDGFSFALYSRLFYQIPLCNEFLRETTDEKLASRNVDAALAAEIQVYRAEARFLRAFSYWHALDIFRNVPFITEQDAVGSFLPEQIQARDLFAFIEAELLEIEPVLMNAGSAPYGRADQGALWALLAKLYQNAEVYIGENKYNESLIYCERIIQSGAYQLDPNYQNIFLADNDQSPEIIFPITFDGISTRTWGGTTFIIRAGIGGQMDPTESGVASGWGGTRTTRQLVEKFGEIGGKILSPSEGNTASYPKLYVPGEYQGWDPGNVEFALSSPGRNQVFEGYKFFPTDNSPFLFTRVPAFALIFGDNGADGTLESNGDTIRVPEAGMYYIQADLNNNTYTLEKRSWSIKGDAIQNGDQEISMTWDEERQALVASADFQPGTFYFRANGSDDIVLGDSNADVILEANTSGITISKAGVFEILLYLDKPDYTYEINLASFDNRGLFFSEGQKLDIDDLSLFTDGYAVNKFKNVTSTGANGSNTEHPDTDFPVFRLADIYLMAAENLLRLNGDKSKATEYANVVRARAFQSEALNLTEDQLTLDYLIDERARELYWECHRRTDLVRFGLFTTDQYIWAWKGGVKDGRSVEPFRDVFPIPSSDLGANPNLVQNPGY